MDTHEQVVLVWAEAAFEKDKVPHGLLLKGGKEGVKFARGYDVEAGVGGVKDLYAAVKWYTWVSVPQNRIYEFYLIGLRAR
jgi:hypothetical protein